MINFIYIKILNLIVIAMKDFFTPYKWVIISYIVAKIALKRRARCRNVIFEMK